MNDPFATAALRAAVLDAWAASPTRFREDANAEEDLRLGGYADTWFVELAQNAADAAGHAGRLRVTLAKCDEDGRVELRVANTGAPLTAAGVAALASLRASAKRDDAGAVGRFGVGFAAVLAVSDAPRVVSTSGAVAFSAARTAEAVADLPGPAAELARRESPPVLRLIWPSAAAEDPPAGFATEVRLPLREGVDGAALLAHARSAAPDLLLALAGLVEVEVDGHVARRSERGGIVTVGSRRWRVVRRSGGLVAVEGAVDVAVDVAVEQRGRREWAVTWALPLSGALGDDVAHAPTATAEGLGLPARLIATLPLEPDRRRVRLGPVADAVLAGAAAAYVELVRAMPPDERLALVPEPGFPRSPLDGLLRARVVDALRVAVWLPAPGWQEGGPAAVGVEQGAPAAAGAAPAHRAAPRELAPGRAEWLDIPGASRRLAALLADAGFDDLACPPYLPAALTELGARRVRAAELVERLFGVAQPPSWWRALYAELAGLADVVPGLVDDL
ncbi:MAG: sensor histidine kinase, partial [Pseudonocardia sp.]|nr:sensor histidine kinase [Pseudonocardia sp.]